MQISTLIRTCVAASHDPIGCIAVKSVEALWHLAIFERATSDRWSIYYGWIVGHDLGYNVRYEFVISCTIPA